MIKKIKKRLQKRSAKKIPTEIADIGKGFRGDIRVDNKARRFYSHDTSLFEIKPQAVLFPKDVKDVKNIVKYVSRHKKDQPELSITARSGGTDMSGGAINDSLIMVFERYFKRIGEVKDDRIEVEPGVYYRDFEPITLKSKKLLPSYPASRGICALGGMISNNSGGEKSLAYGKTENYVTKLKVVLADGNEYEVKPLNKVELKAKLAQKDYEGEIYRQVFNLVNKNYNLLKNAKPKVSKNSTGYLLWDIYDKKTGIFDLTKVFIGSQGTLGMVTDIEVRLVEAKPHSGLLVAYVPSLDHLGAIIEDVVPLGPTSFETFDDHTFGLAIRFFPTFRKTLGWKEFIKLALSLIPDVLMLYKGMPKLIMMVEFEGENEEEIKAKLDTVRDKLKPYDLAMQEAETEAKSRKYWLMRRESFNLLRKNVKDKHTAPFIDDLVVPPQQMVEFLPKLRPILEKYDLLYTIAGHMGDGNFHIIPLMDLTKKSERDKITVCMKEVDELVISFKGSLSGEHNDGLIRGPFLDQMYSPEVIKLFHDVKNIFDPQNIFNPHKKIDAKWDYSYKHMRDHF